MTRIFCCRFAGNPVDIQQIVIYYYSNALYAINPMEEWNR